MTLTCLCYVRFTLFKCLQQLFDSILRLSMSRGPFRPHIPWLEATNRSSPWDEPSLASSLASSLRAFRLQAHLPRSESSAMRPRKRFAAENAAWRPHHSKRRTVQLFAVGGAGRDRTGDLRVANAALSQLSYSPGLQVGGPKWI